MFTEFKKFIMRGNVIDLAVAVVIGTAFAAIVASLTDDIIMPLVGVLLGGVDFSALSVNVGDAVIAYGRFIQAIVNFLIIGFALFLIIKAINKLSESRKTAEAAAPPEPSAEVVVLTEIRELLRQKQ